jgi:glycosyltransferase involved in cell wall biosynthesis
VADLPHVPADKHGWPWEGEPGKPYESKAWPTISVVTPSYNQGEFIEATLRSVLLQHYPNLEYIVLDGASTDDSVRIIEKYAASLTHWQSRKDDGQAAAIRTGFEMATGEILCWLNSDDIFLPNALQTIASIFMKHPRVDFVYGNRLTIDREGNVTGKHIWPWRLTASHWALGQPLAQESSFWRREIYDKVGGIDPSKFFIMDYDLFVRMWRVGRFRKTSAFLGCLRQHPATKGSQHRDRWQFELSRARETYGLKLPGPITSRILNRLDRAQVAIEQTFVNDDPGYPFGRSNS